jgi:hypothetical protein
MTDDKPTDRIEAAKALYRELRAFTGEEVETREMLAEAFMETLNLDEQKDLARLLLARVAAESGCSVEEFIDALRDVKEEDDA